MRSDDLDHLPADLVTHVTEGCGERGIVWLHELPNLIDELEKEWRISIEEPFPGIEFNYVAPATKGSEPVVVKIHPPWKTVEIFDEADYLRVRNGEGCVRLLEIHDPAKAILLERLLPGKSLNETYASNTASAVRPAIEVLRNITLPASEAPVTTHTLDVWFSNFERYVETDFPADYADKALEIYRDLSRQTELIYYIHGDLHPGNIVSSDRGPYLAIDPKGIIGHIGYEIAVFLNNFHWWQEQVPDIRSRLDRAVEQFAAAFGIPESELRRWAFAQMVIGAWWNFTDMPGLYDGSVVKADIWGV